MEQLKKEFEERFVAEIHGQALWDDNDKKLWEWVKSKIEQAQQQVSVEPEVMQKLTEIKQEITSHFESENMILDNAKEDINEKEYKYRKAELKRQKFYIQLILSKFSA